jgi:hypothetical protein
MYFVRNYELLTRVLWDIYQTRIVDCNRKSSPEKLRRTPDVVVHALLCGFWCSCQDVNLSRFADIICISQIFRDIQNFTSIAEIATI